MSDIFDERKDLKNLKSFVSQLRDNYQTEMHERVRVSVKDRAPEDRTYVDPEEIRLRSRLVTHWPGDEIVGQVIKDSIRLMINNDIEPSDLL